MKITRLKRQLPLPNSFIGGNFFILHLLVAISTFCLRPILLLAVKSAPGIHSDYLQPIILQTFRPTKFNGFLYTAFWKLSWTTWSNCLSSSQIDFCFKFTSDTKEKIPKDFSFQSVANILVRQHTYNYICLDLNLFKLFFIQSNLRFEDLRPCRWQIQGYEAKVGHQVFQSYKEYYVIQLSTLFWRVLWAFSLLLYKVPYWLL